MNSTLTGLVNDVYTLTNRPDLVGETLLAVRNATLKAHSSDFYPKDLFETGIIFDYEQAQQTFAYKELIPRWRALKYLREYSYSGNTGTPGKFLDVVTPETLLDSYNIHKEDVCYLAGYQLQIRAKAASKYFLLGCYVHPTVTPDNYNSWIADEHPSAIIYEAAATIFKTIGYDEQTAAYRGLVADEYALLRADNILAVGY